MSRLRDLNMVITSHYTLATAPAFYTAWYFGLLGLLVIAVVFDWRHRIIPNWLCLVVLVAGFSVQLFSWGFEGLINSVLSMLISGVLAVWLYLRGAFGGGDLKLLVALSSFFSPLQTIYTLAWIGISAGIIAVIFVAFGITDRPRISLLRRPITADDDRLLSVSNSIPLAPAIAIGTSLAMYISSGQIL